MYLPQFFKDNNVIVELVIQLLKPDVVKQYQNEERTLMFRRLRSARYRLKDLIDCMRSDTISTPEKVEQLKQELAHHHQSDDFLKCTNMGDLVRLNLKVTLVKAPKTALGTK
jgi:hypothetical protein